MKPRITTIGSALTGLLKAWAWASVVSAISHRSKSSVRTMRRNARVMTGTCSKSKRMRGEDTEPSLIALMCG